MLNYVTQLKQSLKNFLAPAYCSFCKILLEDRFPLCQQCLHKIEQVVPISMQITSQQKMSVFAVGAYTEPLMSLIRAKQNRQDSAAYQLGALAVHRFVDRAIPMDYLVPIPLHWRRYAARGYNQAELMALEIGRAFDVPVAKLLVRERHTAFQMTCAASERHSNVLGAFSFTKNLNNENKKIYKNKHLELIRKFPRV